MINFEKEWEGNYFSVIPKKGNEELGIGFATIVDSTLQLAGLTVYPPYQQQGIGTDLLNSLISIGRENGATTLVGSFSPDTGKEVELKRFYERNGISVDSDEYKLSMSL